MDDSERTSSKRLVLCFDGTGNKFSGSHSDTNIVKIYRMLDRTSPDQYHYYQPGIGTYAHNQTSNSSTPGGLFSRLKASIESSVDQAIGTSFVHHVLAGYRFLMRYYSQGDHIYIFGFSRGAYTARFLAEMIQDIGLLSKGNEEMVHFAWNTFSDYQRTTKEEKEKKKFMDEFKKTFCRLDVNIYFLGLFDCVNSVGQFEIPLFRKSSPRIPISPANHIRHAVSIHERRLKFKPALFGLDDSQKSADTDLKEMWFAGNHGDIGGGWGPQGNSRLLSDIPLKWMIEEVKSLESDIPLKWMIEEVKSLDDASHLAINDDKMQSLIPDPKLNYNAPHDMLAFGSGPFRQSWPGVLGWWILEILPFFTRLELEERKWVPRYWPPNLGAPRDIPTHAHIHEESVDKLLQDGVLREDQKPVPGGNGNSALPKWYAMASLLALGMLGATFGVLRG